MFARAASRSATRAAQRSTTVTRRWASTSAPVGSDTPWMLGSAAVFGSAGAYLLMSSSTPHPHARHAVEHDTTHMHEHKAGDEKPTLPAEAVKTDISSAETNKPAPTSEEAQDATSGKSAEVASIQRSLNTDAPAQAQHSETEGKNQADEPTKPVEDDKADVGKEESSPGPADEPEEGRKAEDIPEEEIKESVVKAVHVDVPKVAMADEVEQAQK